MVGAALFLHAAIHSRAPGRSPATGVTTRARAHLGRAYPPVALLALCLVAARGLCLVIAAIPLLSLSSSSRGDPSLLVYFDPPVQRCGFSHPEAVRPRAGARVLQRAEDLLKIQ